MPLDTYLCTDENVSCLGVFVHFLICVIFVPVSFYQLLILTFATSSYLLSTQAYKLTDLTLSTFVSVS